MSTSAPIPIIQNGLVLCLDAANTKSYPGTGTTWNDLSRTNNNSTLGSYNTSQTVTLSGVTAQTIVSSKSSWSTSYATIPNSSSLTIRNNISWVAVAYKTTNTDRQTLFGKTLSSPWDGIYVSLCRDGNGQLSWWSGANNGGWWDTGLTVPLNTWCFVAGNWTSNTRKAWLAYKNYSLTSSSNNNDTFNSSTDSANFGIFTEIWSPAAYYTLDGGISYLALYNTYLTDSQILQIYNSTKSRFGL